MSHDPKDLIQRFGEKHKQIEELKFISECGDDIVITLISGLGYVNYIYLVQPPDKNNGVILKYGEEQASSSDMKDFTFSMKRQQLEFNCLQLVDKLCPAGVPKPYVYDKDMQIIAMEYLENTESLQSVLVRGEMSPKVASELGRIMGCFHFNTHRKVVSEATWHENKQALENKSVLHSLVKFLFEMIENYKADEAVMVPCDEKRFKEMQNEIISNQLYEPIRNIFMTEDCFGHLDGHGLAVMVSKQRFSFIDFEFGGLTSHSFNLGKLTSSYFLALYDVRNKMVDKKELTKHAMRAMVDAFIHEFGEMVHILEPLEDFFADVSAIFGHTLFTASLVSPKTRDPWFRSTDEDTLKMTEKGFYLLKNHREMTSMDKLIQFLFDEK